MQHITHFRERTNAAIIINPAIAAKFHTKPLGTKPFPAANLWNLDSYPATKSTRDYPTTCEDFFVKITNYEPD
jgi:hypothetical protein